MQETHQTCDLYFAEFSEMTEHQKISLLVQRLTGWALDWAVAFWQDGGSEFQDYLQSRAGFKSVFDFPDQGKISSTCLWQNIPLISALLTDLCFWLAL